MPSVAARNLTFEWDDAKAAANAEKHGVAFAEAVAIFADHRTVEIDATRQIDGESRLKAIGSLGGRLMTVVFTRRGPVHRVISARRSNRSEERAWRGLS